jgi:hypothetical protein
MRKLYAGCKASVKREGFCKEKVNSRQRSIHRAIFESYNVKHEGVAHQSKLAVDWMHGIDAAGGGGRRYAVSLD